MREAELSILNAAFEADGWARATESIAAVTGSAGAQLIAIGGPMLLPLNFVAGNYSGYESYFRDPALHGQSNWRVSTTIAPMQIQHEADYAAYRLNHDTSDYDDAVADLDIPFGCQSAILFDRNNLLGLALLRSIKDGPCTGQVLADFAILRTQLARAVRMQIALDGEAAELMVGDLSAMSGATILLDRHGSLCALSECAEPLLGDAGPLHLDGLAIRLRDRARDRHFQTALAQLLKSDGHRDSVVYQTRVGQVGRAGRTEWNLYAVRLPHRIKSLGFDPHIAVTLKPVASRVPLYQLEAG